MAQIYDFEQDAHKVLPCDKVIEKLDAFVKANIPLQPMISEDELILENYVRAQVGQTSWYFHPGILKILGGYSLTRYAMLLNMRAQRDSILDEITISSFIFTKDKKQLADARGLGKNVFDRFDTFRCTPDGIGNFRKNGSRNGPMAVSLNRRNQNKIFLHLLMYGEYIEGADLTCALTGEIVNSIKTFNEVMGIYEYPDIFQLHHVLYAKGVSTSKTNNTDPSEYLNKGLYCDFPHDVVVELMGCIVLSENSHSRIHKVQRNDDINGWLKKYKRGDLAYLPYHWKSEENYNNTVKILTERCRFFNSVISAPSYNDFIISNTSRTVISNSNPQSESMFGSLFCTSV